MGLLARRCELTLKDRARMENTPPVEAIGAKYRSDYKTSDPNWYSGFNPNLKVDDREVPVELVLLEESCRRPEYQTPGSAGMDLCSVEVTSIAPGQWTLISTGLMVAIPEGFVGMICPRSGLAFKHGVTVLNGPGVIDSDFRGELKVILVNHGVTSFQVQPGDRVAQLVVTPVMRARFSVVPCLSETSRGSGGFGSTGRR
jgi:dUTP pyrophosphatase